MKKFLLIGILLLSALPAHATDIMGIPLPEDAVEQSKTTIATKTFAVYISEKNVEDLKSFFDGVDLKNWKVKSDWSAGRKSFVQQDNKELPRSFSVTISENENRKRSLVFSVER